MKRSGNNKLTAVLAFALTACMLFGLVSGVRCVSAEAGAADAAEVKHYTIFGALDGYEVIVSGEHVYDGQTLAVGTRFSVEKDCKLTKIRKYFGKEEHGTFVAAVWSGETGELIRSYDWTLEHGNDAWEELTLPEPIDLEAEAAYVVEIQNTKESPYYVYVRGYFEDNDIEFFDISGGNSVFSEKVGEMSINAMGGNANFLVDVEVEYTVPAPAPTAEPTDEPTAAPTAAPTEAPAATEANTDAPAKTEPAANGSGQQPDGSNAWIYIVCAAAIAAVIAVVAVVLSRKKKQKQ